MNKFAEQIEQGTLILTVNRRLARFIVQGYETAQMEAGREVWPTPQVLPLTTWLQQLWQSCCFDRPDLPYVLDDHQSLLLWEQVISESNDGLLNIAATARSAAQAWRLMQQWQLSEHDLPRHHNLDVDAFRGWMLAFKQQARQGNWLDSASLLSVLLERLAEISDSLPDQIMLYGFDELTPQLYALIDGLQQQGGTVQVQNSTAEPGEVVRVARADHDRSVHVHHQPRHL